MSFSLLMFSHLGPCLPREMAPPRVGQFLEIRNNWLRRMFFSDANQPIQSRSGSLSSSPNHPQARPRTARDKACAGSLPQSFTLEVRSLSACFAPSFLKKPQERLSLTAPPCSPASWPTRCFHGGTRRGPCVVRPPLPSGDWDLLALPLVRFSICVLYFKTRSCGPKWKQWKWGQRKGWRDV